MKNIFSLVFLLVSINCFSQGGYIKVNNSYGTISNRASVDSTLFFPTGSGAPSLRGYNLRKGAVYLDSTAFRLWIFNPSTSLWDSVHIGAAGSSGSSWLTTGNTGIDTSVNWLGTNDANDLKIVTNGVRRFTVNTNGALGIGAPADYGTSGYLLQSAGSGGSANWTAYTLQKALTAGSTLNQNDTIDTDNNLLVINSQGKQQFVLDPANLYWAFGDIRGDFGNATSIHIADSIGEVRIDGDLTVQGGKPYNFSHTNYPLYWDQSNLAYTAGWSVDSIWRASSDSIGFRIQGATGKGGTFGIYAPSSLTASSVTTLTNKRWTARVGSTTSSATPTINTDNYDIYKLTAQAADITSMTTNLSGTPVDGDILEIQITGTAARAITWGSSFVSTTVTLPTTTVTTTTLTVILQYYTSSSYGNNKWHCVNYY